MTQHRDPSPPTLRKQALLLISVLAVLFTTFLPAGSYAQENTVDVQAIFDAMSVADRIGQLFIVSFDGNDPSPDSAISELIRDYRIGGVVLDSANGNFRNLNADSLPANTPQQVISMTNRLQALAFDGNLPAAAALNPTTTDIRPLPLPEGRGVTLPLLIGVQQEGDGYPNSELRSGYTPLPSNMALGATWNPVDAAAAGRIVGEELALSGINMLLGPALDVLDAPRPDPQTSLGVRSFGGSPYWVGRLGKAFIGGVHAGSDGQVTVVARHFPGQGSADRIPETEVPTIQKTAEELTMVDLQPFAAAARPGTLGDLINTAAVTDAQASAVTDALLSTHVRYAGLQGSGEGVPPISLAPQLGEDLLNGPAFAEWRAMQGLVMSDELGAPAIRRYYDPTLQSFPYKRIAQEALLAGNDLLWLSRFSLDDNPDTELANIEDTVLFFREKYGADADFRRRVDAAVLRILTLKARLNPELDLVNTLVQGDAVAGEIGKQQAVVAQIARDGLTLLSPSPAELGQRMPTGPGLDDKVLLVTDARLGQECNAEDCPSFPLIDPTALEQSILRLYGPGATGQVSPDNLASLSSQELSAHLAGQPTAVAGEEIDRLIDEANWIVFATLDNDPAVPGASALREFLTERPAGREKKRIIAFAFNAPYFLDATDIAKLTAYFGVYGKTEPFVEAATRALFREFTPPGAPPVNVTGINYSLADKLRPAANQSIEIRVPDVRVEMGSNTFTAKVGDTLRVVAGPIYDGNGRIVPDGTMATFKLKQRNDPFELPLGEASTTDGFAESLVTLERPGDYEVQVQSGQAQGSLSLLLNIVDLAGGEAEVLVATPTVTPSPLPTETPTPTYTASPSATPQATPEPTPEPTAIPPLPPRRVDGGAFSVSLLAILLAAVVGLLLYRASVSAPSTSMQVVLTVAIGGLVAYLLYALGLVPGADILQRELRPWGAAVITLVGSALALLALWAKQYADTREHE